MRAQIVAYYFSLTSLLDDVPAIRQANFMIGRAGGPKVSLDSAADLCPDPRYKQLESHASLTCRIEEYFTARHTSEYLFQTSLSQILKDEKEYVRGHECIFRHCVLESAFRCHQHAEEEKNLKRYSNLPPQQDVSASAAAAAVCRRKDSPQPVVHPTLLSSAPHV